MLLGARQYFPSSFLQDLSKFEDISFAFGGATCIANGKATVFGHNSGEITQALTSIEVEVKWGSWASPLGIFLTQSGQIKVICSHTASGDSNLTQTFAQTLVIGGQRDWQQVGMDQGHVLALGAGRLWGIEKQSLIQWVMGGKWEEVNIHEYICAPGNLHIFPPLCLFHSTTFRTWGHLAVFVSS